MDTPTNVNGIVEAAYEAHRAQLIRYTTGLTRDVSTAEDLVQDAFVRLTIETAAGRAPDDVGAWLHRVAHNLAMSRGRHLTVADRRQSDLAHPDQPESPEHHALVAERDREVQEAVSDLQAVHRYALLMAAMGYGGIDIARSIGRTEAATRTLLCRARAKVRTRLNASQVAVS
jgi:RNA polymerase sigma factor (sigma-70 family)